MCSPESHSGLIFACCATSVHCLISFLTSAPSVSGPPPTSVTSILAAASFISGSASTLLTSPLNRLITAGGVLAGTITPVQASTTMLGKPDSAMVGTSGNACIRCELITARNEIVDDARRAFVRDMDHLGAGLVLEQLHGQMKYAAGARRRIVDLARPLLGPGDQLFHRLRGKVVGD